MKAALTLALFGAGLLVAIGHATAESANPAAPAHRPTPPAATAIPEGPLSPEALKAIEGRGALRCNEGCNGAGSTCAPTVYFTCMGGQQWYPQQECDYHVFACGDDCAKGAERTCSDNEVCTWSSFWNCVHSSWVPARKTNQCS